MISAATDDGIHRAGDGRIVPPAMFAGAGLDAEFWSEGFVQLPLLDPAEFEELRTAFTRLSPFDQFDPRTLENPRCNYHCTFLDPDRTYRRDTDTLVRTFFGERLRKVMPGYRILTANIYVKPPGVGRFEIHQNWPTIDQLDIPTVTAWVPLQHTDFHNGGIRVVRRCHHLFPDVAAASSDRFFDDFERDLIENHLEPMTIAEGDVFIFDDSLLHWSGANLSDRPRITFQIEMVPDDATTVLWVRDPEDEATFEVWEMDAEFWIEHDITSVLGRPEGMRLLDRVPNPNRRITIEEFRDTLRRGDDIRRSKYVLPA